MLELKSRGVFLSLLANSKLAPAFTNIQATASLSSSQAMCLKKWMRYKHNHNEIEFKEVYIFKRASFHIFGASKLTYFHIIKEHI